MVCCVLVTICRPGPAGASFMVPLMLTSVVGVVATITAGGCAAAVVVRWMSLVRSAGGCGIWPRPEITSDGGGYWLSVNGPPSDAAVIQLFAPSFTNHALLGPCSSTKGVLLTFCQPVMPIGRRMG